jgi:hypothetical protein
VTVMVSLHGRHYRKGRGEAPSKEGGEEGARLIELLAHIWWQNKLGQIPKKFVENAGRQECELE